MSRRERDEKESLHPLTKVMSKELPLSLDKTLEDHSLSRRSLLKGLSIFLGVSLVPSLEGCRSRAQGLPPSLQDQVEQIQSIQRGWSAPKAVIDLGREVIAVNGQAHSMIETLLMNLSSKVNLESATPQELAKELKMLHLEAAQKGLWVEVRAWRLSSVEAAAYALSSFDLS